MIEAGHDAQTYIEISVILLKASINWGLKIYPVIWCMQILRLIMRYV